MKPKLVAIVSNNGVFIYIFDISFSLKELEKVFQIESIEVKYCG